MTADVLNPVTVEQAIRTCARRIADGVQVCNDRYTEFLAADRAYDAAYARSYLNHPGAAHEKRYGAELATRAERAARDVADAAYRYADRQAKAISSELDAWRSLGASVRQAYSVAGAA